MSAAIIYQTNIQGHAPVKSIFSQTFTSSGNAWSDYTLVAAISSSILTPPFYTPRWIRATLQGGAAESYVISKMAVGNKAPAGEAWDADSSLTQLFYGGAAGGTAPLGGTITTDWVRMAWNRSQDLIFKFYTPAASADSPARLLSLAGAKVYYKAGDDVLTYDGTGYTDNNPGNNELMVVQSIEVSD